MTVQSQGRALHIFPENIFLSEFSKKAFGKGQISTFLQCIFVFRVLTTLLTLVNDIKNTPHCVKPLKKHEVECPIKL